MPDTYIRLADGALELTLVAAEDGPVMVGDLSPCGAGIDPTGAGLIARGQPMLEVLVLSEGHSLTNMRLTHSAVGARLRLVGHEEHVDGVWKSLSVMTADVVTGLEATTVFRAASTGVLQTWTTVRNASAQPLVLQAVTSFAAGAFLRAGEDPSQVELRRARSEWCAESRWESIALHGPDGLADINTVLHEHDSRGTLTTTSKTTWSSGEYLPTGALVNTVTGRAWAWQIEHNGAWRWEIDGGRQGPNALTVILSGPLDLDHHWTARLEPGESFTTVPVSVAVSDGGFEGALTSLTRHRRVIRRTHAANAGLPLVFNDYMNTLMGDPTTAKLLPLVDAAASMGAEYFCIDAGWYDDTGAWWASVGEWKPSTVRFPDGGLRRVIDHIRSRGMKPGLWLEPEVVGVDSPLAKLLPDEAFMQRYGQRVVEHSRYHLDLRNAAATGHLDAVVDELVDGYGIEFFKLDYNVTPGSGTDLDALSPGQGLLEHNRAHLAWLDRLLDRHPHVILENCAAGAMRMDYAMLTRLQLQSTSDQQDFLLYAPIAAAAPASMTPEQAANWAYPQPGMHPEEIAFAMVNGMLGRLYLSGPLDTMSPPELDLVHEGVTAYKALRHHIDQSVPFWPLGLPGWFDPVVALGLSCPGVSYLAVWNRGLGGQIVIDLPPSIGRPTAVETLYPRSLAHWAPTIDGDDRLVLTAATGPSARLFRISTSQR